MFSVLQIFHNGKIAIFELSGFERIFRWFWLFGPFFLLIERTPADVWLSTIALVFLCRSLLNRDFSWLKYFWVRTMFLFWGVCFLSAAFSPSPLYALGESAAWLRFPLFAIATVYWLGNDKRLLTLMLFSTVFALLTMCAILASEIFIEGLKPRLSWPYDDLVPGNYLAKVGLPIVVFAVAIFLSCKGLKSFMAGALTLVVLVMTLLTGERINFLLILCPCFLTIFVWEQSNRKRAVYGIALCFVLAAIVLPFPALFDRFVLAFYDQLPTKIDSPYFKAMAPAWLIFEQFPLLGIGPGNFRYLCSDLISNASNLECYNHPHNFYLQILAETGIVGFLAMVLFIGSIIGSCVRAGMGQGSVLYALAWIVPFAFFWPIRSSADFFGQWNNIFLWTGLSLALAVSQLKLTFKS